MPTIKGLHNARLWTENVFGLGAGFLESLFGELETADFAVLVCTPDDRTFERGEWSPAMRDNVLFELGLFMGRIGRFRAYGVLDGPDLKFPSDLTGVNVVRVNSRQDLATAAEDAARKIANEVGLRMAEFRNELAARVDCRMVFLLRQLENGHARNLTYCTGVVGHFHCEPDTPEDVATGSDPKEELAKYTVRLMREMRLLQKDDYTEQFAITDRGRDILAFCRADETFLAKHHSALDHAPYQPGTSQKADISVKMKSGLLEFSPVAIDTYEDLRHSINTLVAVQEGRDHVIEALSKNGGLLAVDR